MKYLCYTRAGDIHGATKLGYGFQPETDFSEIIRGSL